MAPHSTTISEPSPHFCTPLPAGLREHAETMPWSAFAATYSPSGGPVRLGAWECDDMSRLGWQPRRFRATLAVGDRIETATVDASGPVGALTAMLYERG